MESFLLHPYFMRLQVEPHVALLYSKSIPDMDKYKLYTPLVNSLSPIQIDDVYQKLFIWLKRRQLTIMAPRVVVTDKENKYMYMMDFVAERRRTWRDQWRTSVPNNNENISFKGDMQDKEEIVFIVLMFTATRMNNDLKNAMIAHCRHVQKCTHDTFKFTPFIYLLNVFGDTYMSSVALPPPC